MRRASSRMTLYVACCVERACFNVVMSQAARPVTSYHAHYIQQHERPQRSLSDDRSFTRQCAPVCSFVFFATLTLCMRVCRMIEWGTVHNSFDLGQVKHGERGAAAGV